MYRIMVIDDDAEIGARVARVLEKAGFQAQFYGRSFGVLHAVREMACDLIVLDVNMPRLDGPAVARMIRDALGPNRIRVLLYSSMDLGLLEQLAGLIGAHGAVSKQASDEELVARIKDLLTRRGHVNGRPGAENAS